MKEPQASKEKNNFSHLVLRLSEISDLYDFYVLGKIVTSLSVGEIFAPRIGQLRKQF